MSQKAKRNVELPDECWELIFNRVGHHYRFEVISLVSKQFLSVSSSLKHTLTIHDPTIRSHCNLSNFFRRFNKITRIDLKCVITKKRFDGIVRDISRSGLDLKELCVSNWTKIDIDILRKLGLNMKNLTTLRCGYRFLKYLDLVAIASSMPQLQVLDIKPALGNTKSDLTDGFLTDEEIEILASKGKQLRILDLSDNLFVTNNWLIALSLNCEFLTKLVVGCYHGCSRQLTENGVSFALRHCQNLKSLYIDGINSNNSVSSVPCTLISIENSISHARVLCELEICNMVVSDALLYSIATARLPLKKLALWFCKNFTYQGLSFLLQEYQSINHLRLGKVDFLTDQLMNDLSMFLPNLTHMEICSCSLLTDPTFFILTGKCPLLVELKLEFLCLGRGGEFGLEHTENHNIRSLELRGNLSSNDKSLKTFGLVCPNIQLLNLTACAKITDSGIGEILKSCSKLTHLQVEYCGGRRILGTGSELSELNLEVLRASCTQIDDDGMALIGTRCRGLQQLELMSCSKVTEKGVKEVLENCVNLKVINLRGCCKVSSDIVPWMMSARPSLRKIFRGGQISKERNLLLCQPPWLCHCVV